MIDDKRLIDYIVSI